MHLKANFIRKLLYPLLPLYWVIVSIRNILFDLKLIKIHKLNCTVISIGNLSTGGSGKTPMTIFLAKELLKKGLKVGILTRGYGRISKKTFIICNNGRENADHLNPFELGDEPVLLHKKLINVPIAVSKNRINAGKLILQKYKLDTILLDDGFQHRYIKRDIDILLINSLDRTSNYKLLPVGNLREPWNAVKRSDFIILTKTNLLEKDNGYIHNKLKDESNVIISDSFNKIVKDKKFLLNEFDDKKGILLSGIGDSKSFDISSRQLGISIVGHIRLKDHFQYTKKNLKKILNNNEIKNADFILTTEKDLVKVKKFNTKLPVVPIELIFNIRGKKETKKFVTSILKEIKSGTSHKQKQHQQT